MTSDDSDAKTADPAGTESGGLGLSAQQVLTTTRAVRRRLDLDRPVDAELLRECVRIAQQAPSGANKQRWDFVFVTEPAQRAALADLWRAGLTAPTGPPSTAPSRVGPNSAQWARLSRSVSHLFANLDRVPVLLVPTLRVGSRRELDDPTARAGAFGSVLPAVWSFMLAARDHGLGTAWTTPHLYYEREAAALLRIPYETVGQTALIPVAHTLGTDFSPGARVPVDDVIHWDRWAG